MSVFKPAQPSPYQRVALVGPSGSGKSYSALVLAQGKTALISLEHLPPLVACEIFLVETIGDLVTALQVATGAGYQSVVIDSVSTLWNGPNGLLTEVDRHGDRGWAVVRSGLEKLYQAIHAYPGHVIATFRAEEIRLVVDKDGHQRVISQCGKVEFDKQFGANFHVLLEMSGGTADCKKGPPAAYGKLFPFPGAELARLLFSPVSASQASPPAAEIASPLEAAPEPPAHPLEPGQPVPSAPLSGGISTQSSEPRPSGGSEEEEIDLVRLHRKAVAVYRQGVSSADIRHIFTSNGGELDDKGNLSAMPPERRAYAYGQLENARSLAKKEA